MNDSAFSETFSDDLLAAIDDQDDPLLGLEAHLVDDENEVRKKVNKHFHFNESI
jgi:hypothetical protein